MNQKMPFAHLHTYEDIGQIVVIKQQADEGGHPELRLFVNPPSDMLGVCSLAIGFAPEEGDESEGWDRCEATFARFADSGVVYRLIVDTPLFTAFNDDEEPDHG